MSATTLVYLVRHAAHARVHDTLSGRAPGVGLSEEGRAQAARLAERFALAEIAAVHTSPVERAQATAAPIAERLGLAPQVNEGLIEIDFGRWTGATFAALDGDPDWRAWNERRGAAATPAGDTMHRVQARIREAIGGLRAAHPGGAVVCVSHGDVIKAALAGVLGLSLDQHQRFEISPASVSALAVGAWGEKVVLMNDVPA